MTVLARCLTWLTQCAERGSGGVVLTLFMAIYMLLLGAIHVVASFPVSLALAFVLKLIQPTFPMWRAAIIWSFVFTLSSLASYALPKWRAIRAKRRAQITA